MLAVPALVYLLGESVPEATTASLAVVGAGALAGATGHALAGRVCWRHAVSFTLAAIPGIAAGTLAGRGGGRLRDGGFAALVVSVAGYLLVSAVALGSP